MTPSRTHHPSILAPLLPAFLAILFFGIPLSAADDQFPEGPGKAVLLKVCTQCHSADPVLTLHRTREEWKDTVDAMKGYGAEATDEQLGIILDYLVKNFGKS
jgi:mono/diheme cytochrome c family protein